MILKMVYRQHKATFKMLLFRLLKNEVKIFFFFK